MTDLLAQIRGGADLGVDARPLPEAEGEGPSADGEMETFYAKVQEVRDKMAQMSQGQQQLLRLHEQSKTAVQVDKTRRIREQMADVTDQVLRQAKVVKADVDYLEKANAAALGRGVEQGSNEERTRTSITNSLKTKLASLIQDFNSLRNNITNHYRDVVDRRYEIVTGERASDDQLDQLIETGEAENLFQKAILSQGRGKLIDTLNEINERHEAVKELNKSLVELSQMFTDMAVLVEQQGVMINNIETQVRRAKEHVAQGEENLRQAKKLSKNTRKWMCCALIVLLIIAAIIVVVIIFQTGVVGGNKKKRLM